MTNLCASCRAPLGDDAVICVRCMGGLLRDLGDVPALADDLDLTLRKRISEGGVVTLNPTSDHALSDRPELGVHVQRNPYSRPMSDALGSIRNTLTTWIRDFIDHHPEPFPADDLASMSRWLMNRSERIRHHEAAGDIVREIEDGVARCWVAVDLAPEGRTFLIGPCLEYDAEGVLCPGELRAYFPPSYDAPPDMTCTADPSHTYDTKQWRRIGERVIKAREERRAG